MRTLWLFAAGLAGLIAAPVLADGIPAYYDTTGWHILPEQAQHAFIGLRDGRETMLLQVALAPDATPATAARLVWITPVPAPASEVEVEILRGFPLAHGVEPRAFLVSRVQSMIGAMAATQIYPAFFLFFLASGLKHAAPGPPGVVIHQHIRRDGVDLELLGADSAGALETHLREMGVDFPAAGLGSLAPYTGSSACFVVFWIADLAAYRAATGGRDGIEALGVAIDFPAGTGFYPLVASAALPGEELSVIVTVAGFWEAVDPPPAGLSVAHYVGSIEAPPEVRQALGDVLARGDQRYTRFVLRTAPRNLTADLGFRPGAPAATRVAAGWMTSPAFGPVLWSIAIAVFALLSMLAAVAARPALPPGARPRTGVAALMGLSNFATLAGVLVVSILAARRLGAPTHRGVRFALFFTGFFCLLLLGLYLLTSALS